MRFLVTPADRAGNGASPVLMLAHGAGAAMDSSFLESMAHLLADRGVTIARFEFGYMAGRREGGKRKPPPKAELLQGEYLAAIDAVRSEPGVGTGPFLIGGKSMGGRVASLIAQGAFDRGDIAGLVCLGYPFHPPGRPQSLRTAHLTALTCPTLIVQGERDPLGARDEVEGYGLSKAIALHWITGGDHDLVPKSDPAKRGSKGARQQAAWTEAADAIASFRRRIGA